MHIFAMLYNSSFCFMRTEMMEHIDLPWSLKYCDVGERVRAATYRQTAQTWWEKAMRQTTGGRRDKGSQTRLRHLRQDILSESLCETYQTVSVSHHFRCSCGARSHKHMLPTCCLGFHSYACFSQPHIQMNSNRPQLQTAAHFLPLTMQNGAAESWLLLPPNIEFSSPSGGPMAAQKPQVFSPETPDKPQLALECPLTKNQGDAAPLHHLLPVLTPGSTFSGGGISEQKHTSQLPWHARFCVHTFTQMHLPQTIGSR